jgi:lysyl-tRNA synthetase class 2
MRNVRHAVSRSKNFGVTTEIMREGDLDPTLRRALIGIAERWREGAPDRGFSMALDALLSGRDPDNVIAVARGDDGGPVGFQRYVPCRAGTCLSLDAMRRDRDCPNGVNERLIVETIGWAADHGIDEISLNFAFMRSVIEEGAELSMFQSAQAWLVRRVNPYFQIESLYRFNAKFQPRWVPRHLVFRSTGDLGPVGVAALSAEAFLPFDKREECDTAAAARDGDSDTETPTEAEPASV